MEQPVNEEVDRNIAKLDNAPGDIFKREFSTAEIISDDEAEPLNPQFQLGGVEIPSKEKPLEELEKDLTKPEAESGDFRKDFTSQEFEAEAKHESAPEEEIIGSFIHEREAIEEVHEPEISVTLAEPAMAEPLKTKSFSLDIEEEDPDISHRNVIISSETKYQPIHVRVSNHIKFQIVRG